MTAPEARVLLGEPLLRPEQVADFLGVPRATVLDLHQQRRLPGVVVNARTVRFRPSDVRAYVEASVAATSPGPPRLVDQLPVTRARSPRRARRAS